MSRKRLSRSEAEAQLRDPKTSAEVLDRLPDDVDPELAAEAALSLIGPNRTSSWLFARCCGRLPAPVIRAVLTRFAQRVPKSAHGIFLTEAVPDGPGLTDAWKTALGALLDMQTEYAWGSKQRRAKLKALSESPRFLPAIQAAVVGSDEALIDMLAVLAADGSEASIDALLPRFVRAQKDRSQLLDQLARVKTHAAKTPAMEAMLASVMEGLQERNENSPALAFARTIGLEVRKLNVVISLCSAELSANRVPVFQGSLHVDSTRPDWISVHLHRFDRGGIHVVGTSFTHEKLVRDELGLGRCEPAELPAWVERARQKLGISWAALSRGTKARDHVARWLFAV